MRKVLFICSLAILFGCKKNEEIVPLELTVSEDLSSYTEIASIGLGGLGAAEISNQNVFLLLTIVQ
jgi:hypothetical protein